MLWDSFYDIYMNMPYFGWDGKVTSQICAHMSGISELHWMLEGSQECDLMINRSIQSRMTLAMSLSKLYFMALFLHDVLFIIRKRFKTFLLNEGSVSSARATRLVH